MWESETKQKTIARSLHGYDDGIVKFAPPDTTWVASIFRGHPRGIKKASNLFFGFQALMSWVTQREETAAPKANQTQPDRLASIFDISTANVGEAFN